MTTTAAQMNIKGGETPLPVAQAAALAQESPEHRWLVEGYWPASGVGVVGGHPKSLKTWWALELAVSVATGTPCLGQFQVRKPGRVLIYLAEDPLPQVRDRLATLCAARKVALEQLDLYAITAPNLRLDSPQQLRSLDTTLAQLRPGRVRKAVRLARLSEEQSGLISTCPEHELEEALAPCWERGSAGTGHRHINRGLSERFDPIGNVRHLPYDPAASMKLARQVGRWASALRRNLVRMGLAFVEEHGRTSGPRIDRTVLRRAILVGDPRLLAARVPKQHNDLFLAVLIDCSGSMELNRNIQKAKLFAATVAEAVKGLPGVDARFFGFTDSEILDAGTAERCAVTALEADGGNNDAAALWHAIGEARRSRRSAKVILMVSDGSPTECTVEALRALVRQATTRMRIACAQVAVRKIEERCFPKHVELTSDDIASTLRPFAAMVSHLVERAIGG